MDATPHDHDELVTGSGFGGSVAALRLPIVDRPSDATGEVAS